MTSDSRHLLPTDAELDAMRLLDDVMARVGIDGLTAALAHPVLMARVDQHAAAVRESLNRAGHSVWPVGLASYARSIMAAAERMGRPIPEPGDADMSILDWMRAPWPLLRLLGVCTLIWDTTQPPVPAAPAFAAAA